jgi:C4-dicarboxylate-specific signal transduction histidine kinase
VFIYLPSFATGRVDRVPILEVTVPLQRQDSEELIGAAQFLVDGQGIASEYRALDRHLAGLAGQTFLIAAFLLGLILWIVFRRIERLNQQLATQNRDLSRANQELSLAARTAALGAVSAHLMHGLKNPLASLSQYVREHALEGEGNSAGQAEEWRDAVAATRRMQALVEHTTEVLADSRGDAVYEVAINEMVAEVKRRTLAQARQRGVRLSFVVAVNEPVSSRIANLAQLILVNLTENAIQATLTGGTVAIEVRAENQNLLFQVRDEGPGFPEHLRSRLFLPCPSTREGGSGIGLCICKQLADHMEATLELHPSPGGGCIFTLGISRATASNGAESGNHAAVAVGG